MYRRVLGLVWVGFTLSVGPDTLAGMFSKVYEFKQGTTLEVMAEIEPGLRLDTIRFGDPSGGRSMLRTAGPPQVQVAISNVGSQARKSGIAVALFDARDRLLGVASGGDRLFPVKPARQAVYTLTFDNVNLEAASAAKFQITIEPKP